MKRRAVLLLVALVCHAPRQARAASAIFHNMDSAGEGLNDPTPFTPVGGNNAATLGQARSNAIQYAVSLLFCNVRSPIPIEIDVSFDPLPCSASSAQLAVSGATTAHQNFPNAPRANTFYAQALANSLAGADLDTATSDISSKLNSGLGMSGCVPQSGWYYGLDGNAPSNRVDFVTIFMHEMTHGLGFATYVDLSTGAKLMGLDDQFMLDLEQRGATPPDWPSMTDSQRVAAAISDPNLDWTGSALGSLAPRLTAGLSGGRVRMYGPNPLQPGSSVGHISTDVTPDELMEPNYTHPIRDLSLTTATLQDIGWTTRACDAGRPVPALPWWGVWLFGLSLAGLGIAAAGTNASRSAPRRR